jgi:hypothetical protein
LFSRLDSIYVSDLVICTSLYIVLLLVKFIHCVRTLPS